MESSLTLLGMTCIKLHVHLTQTILTKKIAGVSTADQPAKCLAHSWSQSAGQDAGKNNILLKRINSKLTAFNVLHAESSENVLIANEAFTGLSLNLKTGFYDCNDNIGLAS